MAQDDFISCVVEARTRDHRLIEIFSNLSKKERKKERKKEKCCVVSCKSQHTFKELVTERNTVRRLGKQL